LENYNPKTSTWKTVIQKQNTWKTIKIGKIDKGKTMGKETGLKLQSQGGKQNGKHHVKRTKANM
jgi:hypothetical protein